VPRGHRHRLRRDPRVVVRPQPTHLAKGWRRLEARRYDLGGLPRAQLTRVDDLRDAQVETPRRARDAFHFRPSPVRERARRVILLGPRLPVLH